MKHAMADPEIQRIMSDPVIQQILKDMSDESSVKHAYEAMKDPDIYAKIQRLIAAGVIRTA
jgi:stress-induced-phosphoprotein 1